MRLPVPSAAFKTGIFFLVLLCTQYILHNNIFDRDLLGPHTWRQSQTQQNIDCFYEEDNNILHPRTLGRRGGTGINPQEFPLLQWTIAQSYHVLGQNIRSTRIMCFLVGIFSMLGFFLLLKRLTNRPSTWYAGTTLFSFSPVFFYYMMNPLPDLLAFACAVWCMYFYFRADQEKKTWLFFSATLFLSLATLAKLPYIVFAGVPLGFFIRYLKNKNTAARNHLLMSALMMIPAIMWYSYTLPKMHTNATLSGIFTSSKDVIPLWEAVWGNFSDLLPELYLGYATVPLFLAGLFLLLRNFRSTLKSHLPLAITSLLLLLYFIYEGKLIGIVHDYYMLPFVPILILIGTKGFHSLYEFKLIRIPAVILVIASPYVANAVIQPRWDPTGEQYSHELYRYRDELRAAAPDTAMVVMGNDFTMNIMPYYIHKRGWTYVDGELQRSDLEKYIQSGATYLYTNSAVTLGDTAIRQLLKREIGVYGTIHVFELKQPGSQ